MGGKNPTRSFPLPNAPLSGSSANSWSALLYRTDRLKTNISAKYDQVVSDKDHVAATYFFVRTTQNANGGGNIAPWTINQSYTNQTTPTSATFTPSAPTTANQAWLSFTRAAGGRVNLPSTANAGKLGSNLHHPGALHAARSEHHLDISTPRNSLAGPVTRFGQL